MIEASSIDDAPVISGADGIFLLKKLGICAMSTKDAFFQKLEVNSNAKKEQEDALKMTIQAFQQDTAVLIKTIQEWFASSPVKATVSSVSLFEESTRFEVTSLKLVNGSKSLTIVPTGLYYFGVAGALDVTIQNPERSPATTKFSIHWKDSVSKLSGWVLVTGGGGQLPVQRVEFNQENFFTSIMHFA
ncbi:hypothetical protein [Aeromonas veronii]|uniref:hypothetical protein n=1 Tax=Aeromonas veronii TaxID=654 RepID=UPI0011168FB7|nr:hypothetical protein [Aeromonas veronii]